MQPITWCGSVGRGRGVGGQAGVSDTRVNAVLALGCVAQVFVIRRRLASRPICGGGCEYRSPAYNLIC